MPRRVQERQEKWTSGEVLASEPQRIPLTALSRIENWDTTIDGALEAAPGYATEFSIARSRQLTDTEDDETWTNTTPDKVDFEYGFQSQTQVHAGAGTITSTFTRNLGFIGDDFVDADIMHFWFRHTVLANITTVEVRFRVDAGNYFSRTFVLAGADPDETTFDVARSTFSIGAGAPDWSAISDIQVITTVTGAVTIGFDNFRIDVTDTSIQDPSTGILGFDQIANSERFLMVANADAIYSAEGTTTTRRASKLTPDRMVHMIVANDQVFAVNGSDNPKNWVSTESVFRDVGVPAPTGTPAGADIGGGSIAASTYFAKFVFDMGIHGEGNPSPASAAIVVAANGSIDYSGIEVGPPRTTQRLVYRTKAGGSVLGPYFFDVVIANNTATIVNSTNNDTTLGIQLVEDANQPPAGNYIAFANRTLFMAGIPTAQSSVRFSDTTRAANRTIEQWPVLNEFKLNTDDGDRITGLINHGRFIYVFKTRSTWIIDPLTLSTPTQISSIYGTVTQRSLAVIGNVLYAWSAFFGPLEIRGTSIVPIGIGEKNRDREGPGVLDVNSNPINSTLNGIILSTSADFKQGVSTFTNTNADDEPGKIVTSRVTGDSPVIFENQAELAAASVVGTITSGGSIVNVGNAVDGLGTTVSRITADLSLNQGVGLHRLEGTIEVDLGSLKKINGITLVLGELGLSAMVNLTGNFISLNDNRLQFLDSFNVWQGIDSFAWPQTASTGIFFNFNVVTAQKFRIVVNLTVENDSALGFVGLESQFQEYFLDLFEFQLFPPGLFANGSWDSDEIDLVNVPVEWGRLTSDLEIPSGSSLQIQMKSATTAPGLAAELFVTQILGQAPTVAKRQFVQFRALFTSNGVRTATLEEIALTFIPAAKGIIQPQFETCGIFFEDRYWLNAVKADAQKPSTMWKYDTNNRAFTRHTDYTKSDWTFLGTALMSCSAEDGKIFRNVIDITRQRIGDKDGRVIPCLFETADSALGDQSTRKSVRSIIVAARNEAENRDNFIIAPDLEDWSGDVPNGWSVTGDTGIFGGNRVTQETDPRNILNGNSSAKIDFRDISAADLSLDVIFSGRLLNDTNYIFVFNAKVVGASPTIIKIESSTPPAAGIILQDNNTWSAVDNQLADGFIFEERMKKFVLSFKTPSNIESFSQVKISFGYLQNSAGGTMYLDGVSLHESPQQVSRTLRILPLLDDIAFGTEFSMNLVGGDQSTIDLGVRQERFFIDRSLKRNARFRVTHEESEARAKVLGLFVDFAPEKFRNSALIRS